MPARGASHGLLPLAVAQLVAAGASPIEALVSATSRAADAIGVGGRTGRLRSGMRADLLVVAGDPTQDIEALGSPLAVVAGGYVLQRMQEGLFIGLFRIEIHIWRRFDSLFRLVTTRRNPNLIMLTLGVLAGRPDLGMLAVAAWTVASIAVHGVRIVQALWSARRAALTSWMAA